MVCPVPPLPAGSVPVTPGVTFAVPSKLAVDVLARFVLIVRAVASFVAAAAVPSEDNAPTSDAVCVWPEGEAPMEDGVIGSLPPLACWDAWVFGAA